MDAACVLVCGQEVLYEVRSTASNRVGVTLLLDMPDARSAALLAD